MHGFNDFSIMSQQFKNLNTHIGYPYGSPPSPTVVNSNDFTFSDDNNSNIYSSSNMAVPAGYRRVCDTTDQMQPDLNGGYQGGRVHANLEAGYNKHFDDHLNWKAGNRVTNKDHHNLHQPKTNHYDPFLPAYDHAYEANGRDSSQNGGGPFIFGVHTANTFVGSNSTVINQIRKYSQDNGKPVLNQSISDTSSSSRGTEKDCSLLVKDTSSVKKRNRKDKKFSKENRPRIKCVLVGDGHVGKTNLIRTYLENRFVSDYIPTASDIYNAEVMVNDSPVHITLCDTAGQDTLDPLRELCYPDSNVFMLCFSLVKPESFQSIKDKWIPKFSKTKAALVLVGTQADLRSDNFMLNKLQMHGEKPISSKEAWDLATSIGAKYIETSSLEQINVKDAFDAAIWDALLPNRLPPTPPLWKKLLCLA